MGPLLIAGYGAGAFLAASVAMWWHQRSGQRWTAFALAVLLFAPWIGAVTGALFAARLARRRHRRAGSRASPRRSPPTTTSWRSSPGSSERRRPRASASAPCRGAAIAVAGRCGGVPAQIHSDYTFTAIVGVFGAAAAWAAALGAALWLHRLIRHHGRVTRGEPRLVARGGQLAQRRPGAAQLDRRRLGRADALPARGDGRRQPGGAAAHRRHLSRSSASA